MKEHTYHCIADRPEVSTYIDTLPADPERDRLTAEYRRLSTAYVASGQRADVIKPRIDQIVDGLIDAEGKEREKLLGEYVTLGAELDLVPTLRSQVARRFAESLNAWARYVRGQVVQEQNAIVAKLNRLADELDPPLRKVHRLDQSTRLRDDNQSEYAQASEAATRIRGEMQPYRARHDATRQVLTFIEFEMGRYFGESARTTSAQQSDIDRFVRHVEKMAA